MSEDQLLTAKQAALKVGVVVETIYYWRRIGKLAAAGQEGRSTLFRLEDVQAIASAMRIVFPQRNQKSGE